MCISVIFYFCKHYIKRKRTRFVARVFWKLSETFVLYAQFNLLRALSKALGCQLYALVVFETKLYA